MNKSQPQRDVREVLKERPTGYFIVVPELQERETVDLRTLVLITRRSWKMLLGSTLLAAAIAAVISVVIPNTYRAQALVAPVYQNGDGVAGGVRNQLGGLAALAGIDLTSVNGRREEAYATLASPGFARDFILTQNLMPVLFSERWDLTAQRWKIGRKPPKVEDAVKKFTRSVRSISEDRKTGLVTVTVEWHSAELSSQWANGMIDMVNERLRNQAIRNASQSIDYLNKELAKTNDVELRQAVYRLIEAQVKDAMVASVQRQYAFRFIDAAVTPEYRASPKRTAIIVVGAVLGLFAGFSTMALRQRLRQAPVNSVTPT